MARSANYKVVALVFFSSIDEDFILKILIAECDIKVNVGNVVIRMLINLDKANL
jgi:hypothetical protein